jgi:hypothetical protein
VVPVAQLPKQPVTPGEQPAVAADGCCVVGPARHLAHPVRGARREAQTTRQRSSGTMMGVSGVQGFSSCLAHPCTAWDPPALAHTPQDTPQDTHTHTQRHT